MSLTKLLKEEMKDKQMIVIMVDAKWRALTETEQKVLKLCLYAIVHHKLEDLDWALRDQGYIK